jgi:hypothetical protein
MILKAKKFLFYRASPIAEVTGTGRDGTPTARFDVVERRKDEIFRAPTDVAYTLLADSTVVEARLGGKLAVLAEETLDAESPQAAARAGIPVNGVWTWHANLGDDGYWQPAPESIGPTRGRFEARFANEAEVAAHWAEAEASTPLFSFLVEAGFRRAFIWRDGALLEIATQFTRL